MKIILFTSRSSYGTIGLYIKRLATALKAAGHTCLIVDLYDKTATANFPKIYRRFQPDLTIGINICYYFTDKLDFYDLTGTAHFCFLLDHPFYHLHHFINPRSANFYFSCPDRSHVNYIKDLYPEANVCFIPHGISSNELLTSSGSGDGVRSNRGVFFGSIISADEAFKRLQKKFPPRKVKLAEKLVHHWLKYPLKPVHQVLKEYLERRSILSDYYKPAFRKSILFIMEQYFRAKSRLRFFQQLTDLPVDIYGKIPDSLKPQKPTGKLRLFPPLSHNKMLQKLSIYSWSLNESCFFPDGSHKRIIDSLSQSVPIISTGSRYLSEKYNRNNIIFFDPFKENSVYKAVKKINQDNGKPAREIDYNGWLDKDDTWEEKAKKILSITGFS